MCVYEHTTIRGRRFFSEVLHCCDKKTIMKTSLEYFGSRSSFYMVDAIKRHLIGSCIIIAKEIVESTQDGATENKNTFNLSLQSDNTA